MGGAVEVSGESIDPSTYLYWFTCEIRHQGGRYPFWYFSLQKPFTILCAQSITYSFLTKTPRFRSPNFL